MVFPIALEAELCQHEATHDCALSASCRKAPQPLPADGITFPARTRQHILIACAIVRCSPCRPSDDPREARAAALMARPRALSNEAAMDIAD